MKKIISFILAFIGAFVAIIFLGKHKESQFDVFADKQKKDNDDMINEIDEVLNEKDNNSVALDDLDSKYNS